MGFFRKKTKKDKNENYRKMQFRIMYSFGLIIIVVSAVLAGVILERSGTVMRQKVASLVAADSHQLQMNINSYLKKVESTASLMFADEKYYAYDATDESMDEYHRVISEEKITDRIVDIGLMENFSDFSIIYSNDHSVGWLSKTTSGAFPKGGLYDTFAGCITNQKVDSGWAFGVGGNTDRLYYVKRLNPHAVLVASFYSKELDSVFKYPEELKGITIRLINDEKQILYSSGKQEIGKKLPEVTASLLVDESNFSAMNKKYLVTSNQCSNGWRVVCSVSMNKIMKENDQLKRSVYLITSICVLVFVSIGMIILKRATQPVDGLVSKLENEAAIDALSGVCNKRAFHRQVTEELGRMAPENIKLFVMFDIDNFKQVNDKLGHAQGDLAIARMGRLLRKKLDAAGTIGRVGGDEFSYYRSFRKEDMEYAKTRMNADMDSLLKVFAEEFTMEYETCNVSLSAGVCLISGDFSFEELSRKADRALYISKRHGKNQYTVYREGMEDNV